MNEQWQELKETIVELRDSNGTGTQQEVCKFLTNYMDILEKQMQESCEDAIPRQAVLDMMQMRMSGKELYKAVYDLPPVNPQLCKDTRMIDKSNFNMEQYKTDIQSAYDCGKASVAPCEDCISRQAVLDIVDSYSESQSNIGDVTQDIISDIVALPPVNLQPCEDAIGRSDMLDAIGHGTTYTSEELQRIIKGLPPVNSQAKTGHWIDDKCSICGKGIEDLIDSREWYRNEEPNFCPFCGLKLVKPQERSSEEWN